MGEFPEIQSLQGNSILSSSELISSALRVFASLAALYVVRESLNVLRRIVVEQSCTQLNCDMQREVVDGVMKFDLETLG